MATLFTLLLGGWLIKYPILRFSIARYVFEPYQSKFRWTLIVAIIPLGWLFYLAMGRNYRAHKAFYASKKG